MDRSHPSHALIGAWAVDVLQWVTAQTTQDIIDLLMAFPVIPPRNSDVSSFCLIPVGVGQRVERWPS